LLFHLRGLTGLAIASDIGITIQTAALAILLHRTRLVSLLHLEFAEVGRALLAALVALIAAYGLVHALPTVTTHQGDVAVLAVGCCCLCDPGHHRQQAAAATSAPQGRLALGRMRCERVQQ
jgi:peptidoglycan biosynthesis protein MviN/MurJ (putative lipid II flippase)